MSDIHKELNRIQKELKAPKNQYNKFGKYNYRSCEDILEALKPILGDCNITISDSLVQIGDRYYIEAKARLSLADSVIETTAFARETLNKKGMDESQITGSASSYARKYALNGLFAIDDSKDLDTQPEPELELDAETIKKINQVETVEELNNTYQELLKSLGNKYKKVLVQACKNRKVNL